MQEEGVGEDVFEHVGASSFRVIVYEGPFTTFHNQGKEL